MLLFSIGTFCQVIINNAQIEEKLDSPTSHNQCSNPNFNIALKNHQIPMNKLMVVFEILFLTPQSKKEGFYNCLAKVIQSIQIKKALSCLPKIKAILGSELHRVIKLMQFPLNVPVLLQTEQLSRQDEPNEVPQILKKLQYTYKDDKESLNLSLFHLVLRLCGLSDIIPSLADLTKNGSLETLLTDIAENKVNRISPGFKQPLLILPKDSFYQQFCKRLGLFFNKLLSDDFPFFAEARENQMISKLQIWLDILSKSKLRNIRFAAIQIIRLLIQNQIKLYSQYLQEKQSRKANEHSKNVEVYLKGTLKPRLQDIDVKIRDSVSSIIKSSIQTMENDVVDQNTLQTIFLPSLIESNPQVQETSLTTFTYILKNTKKLKKMFIEFVVRFRKEFQKTSVIPNKNGSMSLKILTEINKLDPEKNLLDPLHISRIFEAYSIEKYSSGLSVAIQAFYNSIYPENTVDQIYENKNMVMIEIVNLINLNEAKQIKDTILNQFFIYTSVDCKKILSFADLFQIILAGEYSYQGEQVVLGEKELLGWIELTCHFARFVHSKIAKYQMFEDEKYKTMVQIWKPFGEDYNNHLLTNIKDIYHTKIQGRSSYLAKSYLKLFELIFFPILPHHENYVDFLIEKMIALFEVETDSLVLKAIVEVFFQIKAFNISALIRHLSFPDRMTAETVIIKKLAILNKYCILEYINKRFIEEIMLNFQKGNSQIKINFIIGLFVIHQWYINEALEQSFEEDKFYVYREIQKQIISFFFSIIASREIIEVRFAAISVLCRMMTVICHDRLVDIASIYFDVSEEDMLSIYRFLDHEYGLPKIEEESNRDQEQDVTRFFNNFDSQTSNAENHIKLLFNLFENSLKIASFPSSIEIILGAFLQEEESVDLSLSISRLNRSIEGGIKQNYFNICARQKMATKFFQKLALREVDQENANRFVFWKFISLVIQFKTTQQQKQKLLNKLMSIYLKKKISSEHQKIIVNKTLLFVMYQFDRIKDSSSYFELGYIQQIIKRLVKRISKESLRRVYVFFRSKYEEVPDVADAKKEINSMIAFLEKVCKEDKNNNHEKEDDSEEEKENIPAQQTVEEVNERNLMRPIDQGPETRSMRKRRQQ